MTTEQLRKVIMITTWSLTKDGLTISYVRENHNPKTLHLILTPEEAANELSIVGNIDEVIPSKNNVNWPPEFSIDGCWYSLDKLHSIYKICQWEALEIAIRHEAGKELEQDLDIFNKLGDLLNPHK
jgi:hypothetical protein